MDHRDPQESTDTQARSPMMATLRLFDLWSDPHDPSIRTPRLWLLILTAFPILTFILFYTYNQGYRFGFWSVLSLFASFGGAAVYLKLRPKSSTPAWIYATGSAVGMAIAQFGDGQIFSPSLWLVPLLPITSSYLLGLRAGMGFAFAGLAIIVGSGLGSMYIPLVQEVPNPPWLVVMLRVLGLLLFSGFGIGSVAMARSHVDKIERQQEELKRARAEAEAANLAKSSFLANMSHEIRTPMNGILGMTQHLKDRALAREDKQSVDTIHSCSTNLLEILNDILDFSKLEAGKMQLEAQEFDLVQLVEEVRVLFAAKAEISGLTLQVKSNQSSRMVRADPVRLRQILSNLVGNAVKFTDEGRVSVHLTLPSSNEPCDAIKRPFVIEVQDEGIGMTVEQSQLVFGEFEQCQDPSGRDRGGTGLGLAISRKLVEAMGGSISVQSAPGEGSTFRVELELEDLGSRVTPLDAKENSRSSRSRFTARALLVDDNDVNRRVAQLALEKLGCRVSCAKDGVEAVELGTRAPYDIIFMDVRMPRLNGLEAAKQLRDGQGPNRNTPIIALTANAFEEDQQKTFEAGMNAHVAKPFTLPKLAEALARFCKEDPQASRDKAA